MENDDINKFEKYLDNRFNSNSFINSYENEIGKEKENNISKECSIEQSHFPENNLNNNSFSSDFSLENENKNFDLIYCLKCKCICLIKFKNINNINVSCECKNIQNLSLDNYLEISKKNINYKDNLLNYFICQSHNKKYEYYCFDCLMNLCEECLISSFQLNNEYNNNHENHTLLCLDISNSMNQNEKEKIEILCKKIKKENNIDDYNYCLANFLINNDLIKKIEENINLFEKKIHDLNKMKNENILYNFKKIIYNLIKINKEYPHFQIYRSLVSALKLLTNFYKSNYNNYSENNDSKPLELKRIISFDELNQILIKENNNLIKSITINMQNFIDLDILCKANLIYLTRLRLEENNITDISPLIKANIPNLKYLHLIYNRIGDDNIQYFSKLNFPKLLVLNLYNNNLTDYEFFLVMSHFPLLERLFIGNNSFKYKEDIRFINFNLSQIKEIGLTGGIFIQSPIKDIISKFKFQNLELLYLSGNKLNSLDFIDCLYCPNLLEIWLARNEIKEYEPLNKYKNLKKINLKENKIAQINNLESFVESLNNLKEMNLTCNQIDIKNKINKNIIKRIKKKINLVIFEKDISLKDLSTYYL